MSKTNIQQNDHEINPDIGYLATYAQDIVGACEIDRRPTDHSLGRWTCGQQFDTDVSTPVPLQKAQEIVGTNFFAALQRHHQEGTRHLKIFVAS